MGLGKITRGLGKVGLAIEALGYVVTAAKALGAAIRRSKSDKVMHKGGAGENGKDAPDEPIHGS